MIYVTVNGNDIPHGRYGVFMSIKSVKFRGRHNSWRAVTALVTGSLAIILFIVMSAMAAASKGSDIFFGVAGIASMLVSLAGVVVSAKATREKDIFVSVPIAGMIVNGSAFLLYLVIYVLGLV